MSLIDLDVFGQTHQINVKEPTVIRYQGQKGDKLVEWLDQSTSAEMAEMQAIKNKLEKGEFERTFLVQSQSVVEKLMEQPKRKYKIRNVLRKWQSLLTFTLIFSIFLNKFFIISNYF